MYLDKPTFCLGAVVVCLAEQLLVLHQVELVAGVQLPAAEDAAEALYVVDVVLGPPDHGARRYSLPAPGTLGPELSKL